jgi:hypothetical protein
VRLLWGQRSDKLDVCWSCECRISSEEEKEDQMLDSYLLENSLNIIILMIITFTLTKTGWHHML